MAQPQLSPETKRRIELLFPPAEQELVGSVLVDECGNNLAFLEALDQFKLERFQFAALKLSEGQLDKLDAAIRLAKTDWRDLLMAAGFGDDVLAHKSWVPSKTWR